MNGGDRAYDTTRDVERAFRTALDVGAIDDALELVRSTRNKGKRASSEGRGEFREREIRAREARGEANDVTQDLARDGLDKRERKIAIALARSRGDQREVIELLRAYVADFAGDVEGWRELGKEYASVGAHDEALFCAEEVLLAMPRSAEAHRTCADCAYAIGGADGVERARLHYAAAIDFSVGDDVRALYGVILCAKTLRRMGVNEGEDGDHGAALAEAAVERLLQRYAAENESLLGVVRPQLRGALE